MILAQAVSSIHTLVVDTSLHKLTHAQPMPDVSSSPEDELEEINDMLIWINDPTLFNDILP
jgi:hypothetical protein